MTDKLQVANTIASQIGNRAFQMLGAKDLVGSDNSLTFKIRGCRKISHIRVTLTPADLYDVEYLKVFKFECKDVAKTEGIYADMMHSDIEDKTGLYTSL